MARVRGLDLQHVLGCGVHREPAVLERQAVALGQRRACARSRSTGSPLSVASRIRRRLRSRKPSVRLPTAASAGQLPAGAARTNRRMVNTESSAAPKAAPWPARTSGARHPPVPRTSRGRPASSAARCCGSSLGRGSGCSRPRPARGRDADCRPDRVGARQPRRRRGAGRAGAPEGAEHWPIVHRLRRWNRSIGIAHQRRRDAAALEHQIRLYSRRRGARGRDPRACRPRSSRCARAMPWAIAGLIVYLAT